MKYVSDAMRVRVAVAGATGGLGRAIVNGLLGEHHEVFVLTRKVICHFLYHRFNISPRPLLAIQSKDISLEVSLGECRGDYVQTCVVLQYLTQLQC